MSKPEFANLISQINNGNKKELVIKIDRSKFNKNLSVAQEMLSAMERMMRIRKLEMAVKKMQISRSVL